MLYKCSYYIIIKWQRLTGLLLQVNLAVGAGSHLGIKVRGGREFGLGIFVTGVDRGTTAELGGLKASVVSLITLNHRSASRLSFVRRLDDTIFCFHLHFYHSFLIVSVLSDIHPSYFQVNKCERYVFLSFLLF